MTATFKIRLQFILQFSVVPEFPQQSHTLNFVTRVLNTSQANLTVLSVNSAVLELYFDMCTGACL